MAFLFSVCLIAGFSHLGVSGRAVNISSAWFLPQEGFPVFYRYFNEKVTWNEAEAVCNSNHADLLSVETSGQMDAARAYLKEIDVTDNIWIGLRKESPEKPFSWTSGEKLLGDGYWTEPIPKTNEKLCAAIDPVADFRWNSFYCRGPQLASFVCELPVPEWAKKENGCLITSLPSLTVTLIPEIGVIQLLSDCGLDGTRRIACSAGLNRDEIIKRLSCDVDAFASTIFSRSTTAGAFREINTQQSPRHDSGRRGTTKSSGHTRHRRNVDFAPGNPVNTPSGGHATSSPPAPSFEDLPVVIITGEKSNESATSENPPVVLMIENKDLDEPFLVPLSDDILVNPSLSPVEVINVDLIEVDNLTVNGTTEEATPFSPPEAPDPVRPLKLTDGRGNGTRSSSTSKPETPEDYSNAVEEEKPMETPSRPNRGRTWTHSNHPSFYPRFLNRVLG